MRSSGVEMRTRGIGSVKALAGTTRGALVGALLGMALLGLVAVDPAWATVVHLENTAPVQDHSEGAIEGAIERALDGCVRAASAMQLTWVSLQDVVVLPDRVLVRVEASDEEDRGEEEVKVIDLAWAEPSHPR
jgi:hypothetical protein